MSTSRLAVLLLTFAAVVAQAQHTIPFKLLKAGSISNALKPSHRVFRTSQEFANYWSAMFGNATMPKGIDWSTSEVVAIHLGHRGSYGYEVRVTSVERDGDDSLVTWSERLPVDRELKRPRASSPFAIAIFPIQSGQVLFKGTVVDPKNQFGTGDAFPRVTFLSGAHCLVSKEESVIITDSHSLSELWATAFGKSTAPPACDFSKWRLVGLFLGQRPTPGYTPIIDRIARIGPHEVQVIYSETKPAPGAILPQYVTNPFVILQIPVTTDELTVEKT